MARGARQGWKRVNTAGGLVGSERAKWPREPVRVGNALWYCRWTWCHSGEMAKGARQGWKLSKDGVSTWCCFMAKRPGKPVRIGNTFKRNEHISHLMAKWPGEPVRVGNYDKLIHMDLSSYGEKARGARQGWKRYRAGGSFHLALGEKARGARQGWKLTHYALPLCNH